MTTPLLPAETHPDPVDLRRSLDLRVGRGEPIPEAAALALAGEADGRLGDLLERAAAVRDRARGRTVTWSPKVFLPLTNLCRDTCDYCSFRRSPGQPGARSMGRSQIEAEVVRAREAGCVEALMCLGDRPEAAFPSHRRWLAAEGFRDTADHVAEACRLALSHGLLPHTNAGVLDRDEMARLRPINVSLGLMLEQVTPRLAGPLGPHRRAPDKRPSARMAMIAAAGWLRIPFTTGLLVGIGETRAERMETLLAIRALHAASGHVQEVIVQNFRAGAATPMAGRPEPGWGEIAETIAWARLVLPDEVSVQSPPNLNPGATAALLGSGIDDFGGVSPVTPDFVNPHHPWPHVERLEADCARAGFDLRPRLPVYDRFLADPGWVDPSLLPAIGDAARRLGREGARVPH